MLCIACRWCAPCRALTPKLNAIIGEKDGLLELAKVDIDVNPDLAFQYNVGILTPYNNIFLYY